MKCPKCRHINKDDAKECDDCGVVFAHIRGGRVPEVDRTCPWNDHGVICGEIGSLSDNTLGQGPWYCATHYWKLKGWPLSIADAKPASYRERWYAERGLDYESPKSGNLKTMVPRVREPGDDDQEVAA